VAIPKNNTAGAYLSKDGGVTFKALLDTPFDDKTTCNGAASSGSGSILFLACSGKGVFKSTDTGDSWFAIDSRAIGWFDIVTNGNGDKAAITGE